MICAPVLVIFCLCDINTRIRQHKNGDSGDIALTKHNTLNNHELQ